MTAPSGLMKCSGYLTLLFSTPLGKKRSSLFPMPQSLYGLVLKMFKSMDHQDRLQGSLGLPDHSLRTTAAYADSKIFVL